MRTHCFLKYLYKRSSFLLYLFSRQVHDGFLTHYKIRLSHGLVIYKCEFIYKKEGPARFVNIHAVFGGSPLGAYSPWCRQTPAPSAVRFLGPGLAYSRWILLLWTKGAKIPLPLLPC